MSQLQDNVNEIKRQKDLYLLPENIRKDLTILRSNWNFLSVGEEVLVKV